MLNVPTILIDQGCNGYMWCMQFKHNKHIQCAIQEKAHDIIVFSDNCFFTHPLSDQHRHTHTHRHPSPPPPPPPRLAAGEGNGRPYGEWGEVDSKGTHNMSPILCRCFSGDVFSIMQQSSKVLTSALLNLFVTVCRPLCKLEICSRRGKCLTLTTPTYQTAPKYAPLSLLS